MRSGVKKWLILLQNFDFQIDEGLRDGASLTRSRKTTF